MTYAIVFDSVTGNTEKLAEAVLGTMTDMVTYYVSPSEEAGEAD